MERRPRDRRRLTTRRRPSAAVTPALAYHHRNPHGGKAVLTGPSFVGTGRAGCGRGGSDVDGDGKVDVGWCRVGAVEGDLGGSPSDVFEWHCCRGEPELQAGQRVDVVEAGDGDVLGDLQAALVSSWITPRATESTTAATAVKGMPFWSACRMACRPDSAVKLPGVRVLRAWAVRRLPSRTGGLPAVVGYSDVEVARRRRGCLDGPD
jgi:hypothetical protein